MGFFDSLFGGGEDDASQYLEQIEPMLRENYQPYIDAGQRQGSTMEQQIAMLLNDPSFVMNLVQQGYSKSPGYQFNFDQAMMGANNAAAAGGALGSSGHMYGSQKVASGLASQDFQDYMRNALGLYNTGINSAQNMYNTGFDASKNLSSGLANTYGSQANLAYTAGQNQQNLFGDIVGIASSLVPSFSGSTKNINSSSDQLSSSPFQWIPSRRGGM